MKIWFGRESRSLESSRVSRIFSTVSPTPPGAATRESSRVEPSMAGDGDGASSSKKRRIESLEKRIKGGGGLMGLGALAASKTKTKQQQQPHQRRGGHHRPNDDRAGGRGPGDAGFGGRGGSGGRGAAKPADGTPAHADKHRPHADKHRPHAQRRGAETPLFRGDGGGNSGPDAAWYAPIGSRTRAGVLASAHRRAYPRDLLPSGGAGRDAGTIGSAEALDDHPSDVEARRRWIRAHLRDLVATNPKAGADAEAVITSKTKDKALLLDSANGGFSVEDVAAARERRALAVGRDAKRLSGAKRKRLGTAVVPRDKARWALFHDMLHTPWCAYVAGVLEGTGGNDCEAERRLRRCELVGSVVSVVACKAPSFCGCEGIVVRDTARTIVLVTRKDYLVTVPKKGAVFAVEARAPTREKGGSDGSDGGGERRVRAVLEGDSLVRSG